MGVCNLKSRKWGLRPPPRPGAANAAGYGPLVGSDLQGLPAGYDFNATEKKKLEGNSFASDAVAIDKKKDARQHQSDF